jgi:hypothetical protein
MDNRPTFYYSKNNSKNKIRAGGILFYYQDSLTKNIKILIQYTEKTKDNIKRFLYEDIGGKTDQVDTCINDTISREVFEETNGIISKELLKSYLDKDNHCLYLLNSKYYLVLIKANDDIKNIDRRTFGKIEENSNKKRQFFWIDANRLKTKGTPFNERIWFLRKDINDFFSKLI